MLEEYNIFDNSIVGSRIGIILCNAIFNVFII